MLPWKQLAKLYRERLKDAQATLKALGEKEINLVSAGPDGDKFSLKLQHQMVALVAGVFSQYLKETPEADNYVEFQMISPEGDPINCIIVQPKGKSPHTLRKEAEETLERVSDRLDKALEQLRLLGHGTIADLIEKMD